MDLIYRGPPFNANRNANVLVKDNDRHDGDGQIGAFTDTRDWGEPAEAATAELRDRLHHAGGLGQQRGGPERPATG